MERRHGGWNYRPPGIVPRKRNRNVAASNEGDEIKTRCLSSDIAFRTNIDRESWYGGIFDCDPSEPRRNIFIYLHIDSYSGIPFLIFNIGFMHFIYRDFVSVFPTRQEPRLVGCYTAVYVCSNLSPLRVAGGEKAACYACNINFPKIPAILFPPPSTHPTRSSLPSHPLIVPPP